MSHGRNLGDSVFIQSSDNLYMLEALYGSLPLQNVSRTIVALANNNRANWCGLICTTNSESSQ